MEISIGNVDRYFFIKDDNECKDYAKLNVFVSAQTEDADDLRRQFVGITLTKTTESGNIQHQIDLSVKQAKELIKALGLLIEEAESEWEKEIMMSDIEVKDREFMIKEMNF